MYNLPDDAPQRLREIAEARFYSSSGYVPPERVASLPDPLPVALTEGASGPWKVETSYITETECYFGNLRTMQLNAYDFLCKPGTYTRLVHKDRGVVMSNTPMEVITNSQFIQCAKGDVFISGLGLGMAPLAVLAKPEVKTVTVVEHDLHIIGMVKPALEALGHFSDRLTIHYGDALAYQPDRFYDVVWHDIWDDISDMHLPQMQELRQTWRPHCDIQLLWGEPIALQMCEMLAWIDSLKTRERDAA